MVMLSNKLEYLAKKNIKFLSKREKTKDKSKKPSFNTRKFRKQIKKSLMETWKDLDSDSDSEKEDSEEDAKVVVGLVATVNSEADSNSDSEDENEICLRAKVTEDISEPDQKAESEESPKAKPTEAEPSSEAQNENASDETQDDTKQAIASGDQVQPVAEGSLVDNPSNFRLEFRNCFPRDISNKLLLELSPAVLDMNLISCRTQGSNEDEERLQKNMSEGEQTRTGLAFTAETLDHADIGTSYTFNMDLCIS
ncbi:uncharacterized G-patch domain protein DDB_G0278987 [Medicago truncatula]|uniref:uncharacterized G-patch domain protein DDB_G0278987 n=1 Tax=Medicago truncatula TaxID=3880 RepID=UPI0019689F4F|nr:uncharacterized G-patch domain protein DDB_G0278987-like [Medicago truncatula]